MLLALCFALLALLFVLPFIPGAREMRRKEDADPLFISMSYCKDPRYFALSFRRMMIKSIGDMPEGIHDVRLSKVETVLISGETHVAAGTRMENVLYSLDSVESGSDVTFAKEVYTRGNAKIGESNRLKALACDGDIHIRKGTHFQRWLDAEGSAMIDGECSLGISATCRGELSLAGKCNFSRLYGYPVATRSGTGNTGNITSEASKPGADLPSHGSARLTDMPTERDIASMPAHSLKNSNLIAEGSLSIGEHSVIHGHIKSHGKLQTGKSVTVMGNVFAEGDIDIGPGSRILGSVFSQGNIIARQGVTIGGADRIKSVVGKKGVTLEDGVRIYGYIVTEGNGMVA